MSRGHLSKDSPCSEVLRGVFSCLNMLDLPGSALQGVIGVFSRPDGAQLALITPDGRVALHDTGEHRSPLGVPRNARPVLGLTALWPLSQ